ncbi:MAG TPA: M14 family zinc carboxypeptidase [Gaiellaceae bacterium]|jgi:protein MpaA|nr:M14 family zinc carboxypeptidase [Gaiellaceae bacterium]
MASITGIFTTLAIATVVGHSVEGRPIRAIHVAGPGPRVLVVGCIHGNECAGLPVVAALRQAHPREDLWLVPTLNPDGLAHGTRQNAHGVDLNRAFPSGREPEVRAAVALIRRLRPDVTIWFHQHQDLVRAWGRSQAIAQRYAHLAGMRYARLEWPTGAATSWQNRVLGERSFVVELPAGSLDRAGVGRQVRACLRIALAAPEFQPAPRALPRPVTPFHRRTAAPAALRLTHPSEGKTGGGRW